jgi:hypothetical protein
MKKIVYSLVGVLLLFSTILFSACNKEDKFYEKTKQINTEFFANEEISFIFANKNELEFNSSITSQITPEYPEYYALSTVYAQTLKGLTYMYTSYQSNLDLEPKHKTSAVKKLYLDFEDQMQTIKEEAKKVLEERDSFELLVGNIPDSNNALSQLNVLKTAYKKLIFKAIDFSASFEKLYTSAFLAYPSLTAESIEDGTQKLLTTVAVGKIAIANAKYIFDAKTSKELKNHNTMLLKIINQLKTLSTSPMKAEEKITIEDLVSYITSEKAFDNELKQFLTSLNNINLTEYENAEDKQAYLQANNNSHYYNKIQEFLQTSANQHLFNIKKYIA